MWSRFYIYNNLITKMVENVTIPNLLGKTKPQNLNIFRKNVGAKKKKKKLVAITSTIQIWKFSVKLFCAQIIVKF